MEIKKGKKFHIIQYMVNINTLNKKNRKLIIYLMFQYKISWWALNFGIVSFFIWFSRPLDQNCLSRCGLIFKILQLNVRLNGTIHKHRLKEYIFVGGSFHQKFFFKSLRHNMAI